MGVIASVNNGVMITSSTGVPSFLANGTTGQVLTATTGSPASWQAAGTPALTITGNDGTPLSPSGGNWNILGDGVTASGVSTAGNLWTTGTGSTLTVQPTKAQFMTNYTASNFAASPYTVLATDYYISLDTSGGAISILLPNAPTTSRLFIIKDNNGHASANNISVTTVGGTVTIDGLTTYPLASNFGAINLLFNGTAYEVF